MLKHENPNIEVINKNLWAVRFSLIPFIPQISYKPDPEVPANQVPGQFGPDGIMVLNKDFKHYELVKKAASGHYPWYEYPDQYYGNGPRHF